MDTSKDNKHPRVLGDDDRTAMTVDAVISTRSQPGRVGGIWDNWRGFS
jgi:hypothetical protein